MSERRVMAKRIAMGAGALVRATALVGASPAWASTTTTTKPKPKVTTTTKAPKPKAPPPLPTPHINQVAKDGDFAFTVTGVQCGVTQIGDSDFGDTAPAGSQWCLATMNVKNDKTASQTFSASSQKAIDGHGNELSSDDEATIYLPNDSQAELATVNPGISITAVVPFQLPASGKIAKFELHDSDFSGGVTVYNVG
jgi:hypothetical protein